MKKALLITLFLLSLSHLMAQTEPELSPEEKAKREKNIQAGNPFKRFGYTPKIATLSKGKYLEFHDLDSVVRIGSFSYHVKNREIVGYTAYDTIYPESTLRPELMSRWISPDPLSEEFPSWSPYVYTNNNPIRFIDPTGMATEDFDNDDPIYDIKGKKIGDDGKTENKIHIVYNKSQAKSIMESTGFTNLSNIDHVTLNGGVETVKGVVNSVNAMGKETSTGAGDAGLHEEGGHTEINNQGNTVAVAWSPGPKKTVTGNGSITVFGGVTKPDNSSLADYWHVHTSKMQEIPIPGTDSTQTYVGSMYPSGNPNSNATGNGTGDYGYQRLLENNGFNGTAIQVGTSNGRVVNFYQGNGTTTSMKFNHFKKLNPNP